MNIFFKFHFYVQGTSSSQAYQVQFDNPQSLKLKYDLAASLGLRGVGMWNIDSLEFTDSDIDKKIRSDMFGALPSREIKKIIQRTKPNPANGVCPCSNPAWCEPIKDINRTEVKIIIILHKLRLFYSKLQMPALSTIFIYS